MATFNVFGATNKKDIRVGYIDSKKGLVEGVTICDANSYAKLNPGTQFIFRNRQEIQYLNINEVNALEPEDLGLETPKKSCQGYESTPPKLTPQECGKAKAYFYGGAGIGVKGTPIIGQDGGLMAVVLTSGGFGYQYPPITEVKDDCGTAGAAVVRSIIGEQVSTVEVYDNEEDFEEYDSNHETCPPAPPKVINRNAAGKVTGEFNPRDYTNPEEVDDPIRREILQYQERLRAVKKPFWSTRMNPPLNVVGGGRNDRTKYDVRHYAWGGSKVTTSPPANSKEFVDVKMNVLTEGGHGRGMLFNFTSEDGTHKFTIKADNFKEERKISITQKVKRNTLYKVVAEGQYDGAGVEQGLVGSFGRDAKEIKAKGGGKKATGDTIFCDFAKSANDNDDLQVQVTRGKFTAKNRDEIKGHDTYELEYIFGDNSAFKPKTKEVIEDTFMNRYAISPVPPSNVPGSDFSGQLYTFEWEESFPYSGEYTFRAMGDNTCDVYLDNRKVMSVNRFKGGPDKLKKVVGAGVHKIRVDLFNIPQDIKETVVTQPPLEIDAADNEHEIVYIDLHPKNKKLKVSNNRREIKFVDGDGSDTNSKLKILEGDVVFSRDGKKLIGGGTVKIRFEWNDDPNNAGIAVRQVRIRGGKLLGSNRGSKDEKGQDTDTFTLPRPDRSTRLASNSDKGVRERTVFTTRDFIDKADRPLWKTNYTAAPEGDFVNYYGISPFDIQSNEARSDDFAGSHTIRWNDLNFPVDGNYGIEVAVDDNVTLRFIDRTGNETIIEKKGFTGPTERGGKGTGVSTTIQNFKAGKYRLVADLYQRPGKSLAGGNPMVLAVKVKTFFVKKTKKVKLSWQQNPMGAAVTIVAPPVPSPELPIPKAPGRCPNNPFWTSRFPGASNYWYPVIVPKRWGKFMNRYAISPLPPLAKRSTDGGGVVYQTTWDLDVPYSGFFGLKATADNGGRILIDGQEVMRGGLGYGSGGIRGGSRGVRHFKDDPSTPKKVFISQGKHKITVEVRNEDTEERQAYKQKIFHTADWVVSQTPPISVPKQCEATIVYKGLHPRNKKLKVSGNKKRIDFSDGDGKFNDSHFEIKSGDAVFSNDGKKLIGTKAKLEFGYYEDPGGSNGEAINSISIGKINWDKKQKPGSKYKTAKEAYDAGDIRGLSDFAKTIIVGPSWRFFPEYLQAPGLFKQSKGVFDRVSDSGTSYWQVDKDDDEQGFVPLGRPDFDESGKVSKTVDICAVSGGGQIKETPNQIKSGTALLTGTAKDGVTYEGPALASYRKGSLGPFITPAYTSDEQYLAEFQGTTWKMVWKDVNFPQQGRYTIQVQADDIAKLRIDGREVAESRFKQGLKSFDVDVTAGKKTLEIELFNQGVNIGPFSTNPTVVAARIDYNGTRGTGKSKSWDDNPMGISAELIPPPCPKEVGGKGVITQVIVDDPGNGFDTPPLGPPPPDAQPDPDAPAVVPVALQLIGVDIVQPGINIRCGLDPIVIEPSNGAELSYDCGTFGQPTKINVDKPGFFVQPPEIRIITETGIPPTFRPQFEVIIDPIGVPDDQLIQVTDLPGIKRTGFVNGRSYFGAVYYEDGLKFAGFFATVGEPVRVYDTLQESIDAQVTTPPSAIQRQGTDITSNDPRLNIPNTPDEIV